MNALQAHSLAVKDLEAFVIKPTAPEEAASAAVTTFVAAGAGFVEMRLGQDGFEFCDIDSA